MVTAWKPHATPRTVVGCYDLLNLAVSAGIRDFTDGMYLGDPTTPYEEAQQNQAEHLLDLAGGERGTRLLEIGCGYGRILESAQWRGVEAMGISISRPQVKYCRAHGWDARLLDYRDLPDHLLGQFDCLIANGSLEHFVQPADAAAGRSDDIYRELFGICHRLLDSDSSGGRLVTTAIHFGSVKIDPQAMLGSPNRFRRGSNEHHYSLLVHGFGGYYPHAGQLERCAAAYFDLVSEEDGTEDYHLTAEGWLKGLQRALWTNPRFLAGVFRKLLQHPQQAWTLLDCLLVAQSWNWQFRGSDPPMRLYRHTWQRVP